MVPKRAVVFRNGFSEFDYYLTEIDAIREGLNAELAPSFEIPITYVLGVSQHSIRVVPTETPQNHRHKNVHSGTCVDYKFPMQVVEPVGREPQQMVDFLLTAHGGLKGTSKPVLYRVVSVEQPWMSKGSCCSSRSYRSATITSPLEVVPIQLR